jgi:hypothetical protein
MSARTSIRRQVRMATTALAVTVVLAGTSAGIAAADPPALDDDPCATALARVTSWPGTMTDGDDVVRLVSDAHDSYLSRVGECSPYPATL